ncbi:MAG: hypothetical protein P9X22_04955 [Candidatus Zapsychrus exili]|nr:hypothetical protein [Candidatus Zapsychrus exili]
MVVGVSIIKYDKTEACLDTFLMSCRVLGRKAEKIFLSECLNLIKKKGKGKVLGQYFSTAKNGQTKDFYEKNGFGVIKESNDMREFSYDLKVGISKDALNCYKEVISA